LLPRFHSSADRSPATGSRGFDRRIDCPLDLPGLAKIRAVPFAAGDCAQELGDLDRLEIVEAQLVSR